MNRQLTVENEVKDTPLPHVKAPPLTPQLPLEDVMVKLLPVPESVNVASVCVDHVPAESRPPIDDPPTVAWIVARDGIVPGACDKRFTFLSFGDIDLGLPRLGQSAIHVELISEMQIQVIARKNVN